MNSVRRWPTLSLKHALILLSTLAVLIGTTWCSTPTITKVAALVFALGIIVHNRITRRSKRKQSAAS